MDNKRVQDENKPSGTQTSKQCLIRPPTALKRRVSNVNGENTKLKKATVPGLGSSVLKKEEVAIMRRQTFTIPQSSVAAKSQVGQVSESSSRTASNSTVSRARPPAVAATAKKARPAWDYKGRCGDLELAIKEHIECSDQKIKLLEEARENLTVEKKEIELRVVEYEEAKTRLQRDMTQVAEQLTECSNKLKELEDEHGLCHSKLAEALRRADELYRDVGEKEICMSALNNKVCALSDECSSKSKELDERADQITDLKSLCQNLAEKLDAKRSEYAVLLDEHDKFRQSNVEKCVMINSLQKEVDTLKDERENLLKNLHTGQTKIIELITEADKLNSDNSNKCQTVSDLELRVTQLTSSKNLLTVELESAKAENFCLQSALNKCKEQLALTDIERRAMHHKILELRGTIRVCCRVRPVTPSEKSESTYSMEYRSAESALVVSSSLGRETVTGTKAESNRYEFTFDRVFGPNSSQQEVFNEVDPLIQSALDGYSVCIFAYGQTGSGKTYTMEGDLRDNSKVGMIKRAVDKIFDSMGAMQNKGWEYVVEASFVEIYNETVRDLLVEDHPQKDPNQKLEIKLVSSAVPTREKNNEASGLRRAPQPSDVHIPNLTAVVVTSSKEVRKLITLANKNRSVAATKCNQHSSRSHSIFRLKLVGVNHILSESSEAMVNLVDLAGSERLSASGAEGDRMRETQCINKSLSCLRTVIDAISKKETHVPYRNSKLTHILQPSLGGNCTTLMMVNASPLEDHFQETLCSLRFASTVNKCYVGAATQKKVVTHTQ